MLPLTIALSLLATVFCCKNYEGYKLLRLTTLNPRQVNYLMNIKDEGDAVSIWNPYGISNEYVTVLVSPKRAARFRSNARFNGIRVKVLTDNIQEWILEERRENENYGRRLQLEKYNPLRKIEDYMLRMVRDYPQLVSIHDIGISYGRNPIFYLKIGTSKRNKPAILIDAGYHGLEWIAPATAVYIIDKLVTNYDKDSMIKKMLDGVDFYIIPVMNPDGYNYSWTCDRFWRKNRSPTGNASCPGVDAFQNFPVRFGGPDTSNDPCSKNYPGPSAFSEAESRATRDLVTQLRGKLKAYITLHSYLQRWLTPYGYTRELPPDYAKQQIAITKICAAIRAYDEKNYTCGTIASYTYPATGVSTDWAYANQSVVYSIGAQLRDTGEYGFLLPNDQIRPTAEESFRGIQVLTNILLNPGTARGGLIQSLWSIIS